MKVTLTLGKKVMEYVIGIPEEELPTILSDLLERSLEQQVRTIPSEESNKTQTTDNEKLLDQIREILSVVTQTSSNSSEPMKEVSTSFSNKRDIVISLVESLPNELLGKDLSKFGLFK